MRLLRSSLPLAVTAVFAVVALATAATTAQAFDLRSPQIPFCQGSLQSYLNGVGESIDVTTAQINAQNWSSTVSGNAEFTLMIELAGNAAQNAIGVYNIDDPPNPPLFQIFPGAATAGWSASVHFFPTGVLKVYLFDQNGDPAGNTNYAGVDRTKFGFYLQGPGGTFYSQDSRNGGNAQILTYAGTGINVGSWWQCFEDLPYVYPDCLTDFEDAVMFVESVNPGPVPARMETWGRLKSLYR
jgi:hypothetical protein